MQITQYNFNTDISLFNIGDLHRADHSCDVETFHRIIDRIARDPNAYWVSTGDLLNVAVRNGKHASIYGSATLEEEFETLVEELAPIKHKCLGVVNSNHSQRVQNSVGINIDKLFCKELGVPYLGDFGVLNLTLQRTSYYVVMHHGSPGGGGRMKGAKANLLDSMEQILPAADLYLTGHTHQFMHHINEVRSIDRKRNLIAEHKSWFCTTGHFLKWENSYAQTLRLRPAPIGAAKMDMKASMVGHHSNKDIKISLYSGGN